MEVGPAAGSRPGAVQHDDGLLALAKVVVVQLQRQLTFLDAYQAAAVGFVECGHVPYFTNFQRLFSTWIMTMAEGS